MAGSSNNGHSRGAILQAAIAEFAERGLEGARIEAIAKRAGFNKALVYRYFGDKEALFQEALRAKFEERSQRNRQRAEGELWESLWSRFQETLRDPALVRLLLREALSDPPTPVHDQMRQAAYHDVVQQLKESQDRGDISAEHNPAFLYLACTALSLFPATFPQLALLITGKSVESNDFQRGWEQQLKLFVQSLGDSQRPDRDPLATFPVH